MPTVLKRIDTEWSAAVVSAVLAMGAFCLSLAATHTYPFGPTSRAVNDLGNQFIPFHAELWDLEHGVMNGDLYFSWSSGYGAAFLPDFFSYLCNPFSWLVGLFPRDLLDFPVFLVTLLSLGVAAAVMTVFLGRLHPGSRWLRMLLGIGYALCGWFVNDAFADPMWMCGLIGLPLICIAADWCLQGRRWVLGALLVTVVWVGHFYTAAMATIGAGLVLVVRLVLLEDTTWAARLRILLRAGSMMLVGVLLAAPVLTVSGLASRNAQPLPPGRFMGAPPVAELAAQFLPGGKSLVPNLNITIGLLGLLLVAAFPFQRAIRVRERLVWLALLVLVLLSFLWEPTMLLWHGLALPNGSPFRAAFVLSGLLTMVAWLSLARRPGLGPLLAGGAVVLALLVLTRHTTAVRPSVWRTVLIGGPLTVAAVLIVQRARTAARAAAVVVLTAVVFFSSAYTAYVAGAVRGTMAFFDPKPTLTQAETRAAFRAIQQARTWPAARVETSTNGFANNDPALLRAEGSRYYDTYVSAVTSEALQALGIDWTWSGRHIHTPTDPVTRALMSVGAYLDEDRKLVQAGPAAPLVTVHPAAQPPTTSAFARQEALLGATVYQIPELRYDDGPAPTRAAGGWQVPHTKPGGKWTSFTVTCAPGSQAYLFMPWFRGRVHAPEGTFEFAAVNPATSNPMRLMGTMPADGKLTFSMFSARAQSLPDPAVGCLDPAKLTAAVDRLRATGATHVETGGHTVTATLPSGSAGMAVMSIPATKGWSCAAGDAKSKPPASYYGFIGVPLDDNATEVHCSFEPPGLRPGLAISAVALLTLIAVFVTARIGRRRQAAEPDAPPARRWWARRRAG
jgi:uncharacterized membrane protein YfhO